MQTLPRHAANSDAQDAHQAADVSAALREALRDDALDGLIEEELRVGAAERDARSDAAHAERGRHRVEVDALETST